MPNGYTDPGSTGTPNNMVPGNTATQQYNAFAVPSTQKGAPNSTPGWSPSLRASANGIPDAQQIGVQPLRDYRPDPHNPDTLFNRFEANRDERSSEARVTERRVPFAETKAGSGKPQAPNPRLTPPPETRMTQMLSPSTFRYTRMFDQLNRDYGEGQSVGSARRLNGMHFSFAAFRKDYDNQILGMQPPTMKRNTYRADPAPWDANVVDMPPIPTPVDVTFNAPDLPSSGTRTWRLG